MQRRHNNSSSNTSAVLTFSRIWANKQSR